MEKTIDTENLKRRTDLRDLAGRFVDLERESTNEMSGPCPKCGGDDRFHVKADVFFCRACYPFDNGKSHDAIAFVQWIGKVKDFRSACEYLGANMTTTPTAQPKPKKDDPSAWQDPTWQAEARAMVARSQARARGARG